MRGVIFKGPTAQEKVARLNSIAHLHPLEESTIGVITTWIDPHYFGRTCLRQVSMGLEASPCLPPNTSKK
jgi:hypothetical protein